MERERQKEIANCGLLPEEVQQGGRDEGVAGGIGVVDLRHEVLERRAGSDLGLKQREAINELDVMLLRQGPHLLGMKVQRVLRVINLGRLVRRRGEQNDFNARSFGGDNHRRPVGLGFFQAHPTVIQGIINRHDGWAYCEDVALKTGSTAVRGFAADGGDDDVEHGVRKASAQARLQSGWIGLIGLNDGRDEITRRDAMPVTDDMHRPVLRPLHFEGFDDRPQGGGLGGSEAEDTSLAKITGPGFDEDGVIAGVEKVTDVYLAQRSEGERFLDTYRRIGMEPFKEALYG